MDFKVRRESQSYMEKMFQTYERRGMVRAYQIPNLLRELNPEIQYDEEELRKVVAMNDEGKGGLDYDAFTRVCLHFLIRQARRDSNGFGHKTDISLTDF